MFQLFGAINITLCGGNGDKIYDGIYICLLYKRGSSYIVTVPYIEYTFDFIADTALNTNRHDLGLIYQKCKLAH